MRSRVDVKPVNLSWVALLGAAIVFAITVSGGDGAGLVVVWDGVGVRVSVAGGGEIAIVVGALNGERNTRGLNGGVYPVGLNGEFKDRSQWWCSCCYNHNKWFAPCCYI